MIVLGTHFALYFLNLEKTKKKGGEIA